MRRGLLALLGLGAALLVVVLAQTDLGEVGRRLAQLGPAGIAWILLAFLVGHLALAGSWLLTLPALPLDPRGLLRVWRVLMVGSALESVTPLGGLGGEPVKAILLKRRYGIPYTEGAASLVLTRMTDLVAQVLFIAIGLLLMFRAGVLPLPYRASAAAGLALFALAIGLFFAVQTRRGFSRLHGWLERGRLGPRLSDRALGWLGAVRAVEDQLVGFYRGERPRFALSVACAFAEWMANALAVQWALALLGTPVGFDDALVIEAFLALVRSVLFFVPGDLGTQEAALVLVCGAVTGSPEAGLALAAVRRARDLLWIGAGLAIGGASALGREGDALRGGP